MNYCLVIAATALLSSIGSVSSQQQSEQEARPAWAAPVLDRAVSVVDGRTGEILSFGKLLDTLATADAVFLGEIHNDETTHRVELGVLEGIAVRRSGKLVLAMEMFQRDVQAALDAYLAGESSESKFLATSRPWSSYHTAYRPMIEFAKAEGIPVIASNFPKLLGRRFTRGKVRTKEDLAGAKPSEVPVEYMANGPAYWRRVDNAVRGHIEMMGVDQNDEKRIFSTQSLWDNSMGESCSIALDKYPGSSVVHVNGGFHSAYWDGTARQFQLRKPDAKTLTVSIVPTANPGIAQPKGAPVADYIVYAEKRATDLNDGTYSVYVQREVEYRLHLPKAAKRGEEVPLLIWFADDGFAAKDGLALLRRRFGDEAAIAVVEAPYRETQDDLVEGGRWFWPDSFSNDIASMETATEEIWAYLCRHYPIDTKRVCIAGEGTGATVVAAVSLATERMANRALAFGPRRYAKIKDIPLPLPEFRGDLQPPVKSLRLFLRSADQGWWKRELAAYQKIGFESQMLPVSDDPWREGEERSSAIRAALGLTAMPIPSDAPRRHIIADGPRARLWAQMLAAKSLKKEPAHIAILAQAPTATALGSSNSNELRVDLSPARFASGFAIPRCPGPFGGTTVIVLPKTTSSEEVAAWLALEKRDPLQKISRFLRLRIVTQKADRQLEDVLARLAEKGRKNVLIIPAMFCAEGELMRGLRKSVRHLEDQMTLRWRPGLGA